ncbi:hypothetical protein KP014_17410 [Paenibacillus sophorae]|uniref:Uncharacterized protein n=1 Tax=Paenibacillus sophorae TaxID=1333845 RepID=A0ABX8H6J6_9BACL|nr:hypothetical protein [Paenibacillus sophorae]QWU13749.1 hypothetical protein KP014_17410 [Paenibacillus sophorae]
MDGDIPHSAKANEEDFYALDFKFLSSETFIRQGVKDYTIDCGSLNKVSICQHSFLSMESNTVFTLEPDSRRQYFLALRQEASIQFNDETHRLTPMHIYRIEAKSPLRIRTFEDGAYLVNYFSV